MFQVGQYIERKDGNPFRGSRDKLSQIVAMEEVPYDNGYGTQKAVLRCGTKFYTSSTHLYQVVGPRPFEHVRTRFLEGEYIRRKDGFKLGGDIESGTISSIKRGTTGIWYYKLDNGGSVDMSFADKYCIKCNPPVATPVVEEVKEEPEFTKFFMVSKHPDQLEGLFSHKDAPRMCHLTKEGATTEAERLVRKEGQPFYVLSVIGVVAPTSGVRRIQL